MNIIQKKVTPITSSEVYTHYQSHVYRDIALEQYLDTWKSWLTASKLKTVEGLEEFQHGEFTLGTSQTFDHFVLRNHARTIVSFPGEFQYHGCVSKHGNFRKISHETLDLRRGDALIISAPFSDFAMIHPRFNEIMELCIQLEIPVCLDLAYWGIAKNINLNLNRYPCITEITSSLSKPFYLLGQHRVGVRFSREYLDDGISMQNEVGAQNFHAMSLGVHFMSSFSADWTWERHGDDYQQIIQQKNLIPTDTVIFALGDEVRYPDFNRGNSGVYRLCIGPLLS
jgi:hypothetical protein